MEKYCESCGQGFRVEACDLEFYEKVSPCIEGQTYLIPPPRFCPTCRMRRRLVWRNEYRYYRRKCDLCAKGIVSVFHADQPFPVYCHSCWWSDAWDATAFGREFDFSKTFMQQFSELYRSVPQKAMIIESSCVNCEYCQDVGYAKDCYLVTGSWKLRDCYYSSNCNRSSDIVDCDSVNINSELVYESSDSQRLYQCSNLDLSSACNNCHFGIDLRGCSDCLACYGLRQQQFRIFNVQYSEQEYRERFASFDLGSRKARQKLQEEFHNFCASLPRKGSHLVNCEDSLGDKLFNCKNVHGFDTIDAEHCRWFYKGDSPKNCYDVHQSGGPQWCYESLTPDDSYMTSFTTWCFKSNRFLTYSDNCHLSENLFACVGLKQQKNAILNRAYSKKDYDRLLIRIIRHMQETCEWGEFFSESCSPFSYNETLAYEYFPLTKEAALARGYIWKDEEPRDLSAKIAEVPDRLHEDHTAISSKIYSCRNCFRHYRLVPQEISFYRKMTLPPPELCVECRRRKRWERRTPYQLWSRTCDCCSRAIESSYEPGRKELVYCLDCYESFVY